MSTKNNPGNYDCYAKAQADEPMFILLGRDKHAGLLVHIWALIKQREGGDEAKISEALSASKAMDSWAQSLGLRPIAARARFEKAVCAFTEGMDTHPNDYDGVCGCDTCLSYD